MDMFIGNVGDVDTVIRVVISGYVKLRYISWNENTLNKVDKYLGPCNRIDIEILINVNKQLRWLTFPKQTMRKNSHITINNNV